MPIVFAPSATFSQYVLHARRTVKNWCETPYDELSGAPPLVRACVSHLYEGGIEGESWEEYLMVRQNHYVSRFVSLERVVGSIGGRMGSFVIQYVGTYEKGVTQGNLTIVTDSGAGNLSGLRGAGTFVNADRQHTAITVQFSFQ